MWIISRIRVVKYELAGSVVFYNVGIQELHHLHALGVGPVELPSCDGLRLEFEWTWVKPPLWRRVLDWCHWFTVSYYRR